MSRSPGLKLPAGTLTIWPGTASPCSELAPHRVDRIDRVAARRGVVRLLALPLGPAEEMAEFLVDLGQESFRSLFGLPGRPNCHGVPDRLIGRGFRAHEAGLAGGRPEAGAGRVEPG